VRSKVFVALGAVSLATLAACSAIIGTRDLTYEAESDAGTSLGDASGKDVASPEDASKDVTVTPDEDVATPPLDGGCSGANLQTDPKNCGTCGHDCLGGACMAGVCQAFAIVPAQFGAAEMAVDATHVYWSSVSNGQVLKAAKDGSGVVVLVTDPDLTPVAVTIDDTSVYWADNSGGGSVQACPKTGCDGGARLVTEANLVNPVSVAVDGTHVFWAEYANDTIGRANKLDGGAFGYLVTNLVYAAGVAVDDASVYFGSSDTIGKLPLNAPTTSTSDGDAGPFTVLYSGTSLDLSGLVVDSTNAYWTEANDPGAVEFAPKVGVGSGVPTALGSNETYPWNIVVDATNVYWTAEGPDSSTSKQYSTFVNGYVATCPKAGCPQGGPTILANNLHNPRGIAVDDAAVYFTIFGNVTDVQQYPTEGSVMKIAK
jgi:hypothetical protein